MPHKYNDADFQAECDMRTLIDAEKIKRDKRRLSKAMRKAREQREALAMVSNEVKKEV